jgi:hypothetical protein
VVSADGSKSHGSKSPPYTILNRTVAKQQLSRGIIIRCQPQGWMTSELAKDWLAACGTEGHRCS